MKPKLRWRDLTDEQRWERIYADRKKRAANRISSVKTAAWLALPAYALTMAVEDCHATHTAYIRKDAHKAVVSGLALVSSRLIAKDRPKLNAVLSRHYRVLRRTGFYTDNREFLYAVSVATVKLADEWRYPPDGPACVAALVFKEDAEHDDNDWGLSKSHALQAAASAHKALVDTGIFVAIGG